MDTGNRNRMGKYCLSHLSAALTEQQTKQACRRRGLLWLTVQPIVDWKSWQQEGEAAAHVIPQHGGREREKLLCSSYFLLPNVLFSSRPQPMGWYAPYSGWIFPSSGKSLRKHPQIYAQRCVPQTIPTPIKWNEN